MICGTRCVSLSIGVACVLGVLSSGCTESNPPKEFDMAIVAADAIGESKNSKLPRDLVDLSLPLLGCKTATFVPKPSVERLGLDPATRLSLETRIDGGFAGDRTNPRLIKRRIEEHLSALEIGQNLAGPQKAGIDLNAALNARLGRVGKQTLPLILSSGDASGAQYRGVAIYSDVNELRKRLTRALCDGNATSAVIFLNPPLNAPKALPPPPPPPPPPPTDTVPVPPSLSEEIESRNKAIGAEREGTIRREEAREAVRGYRPKVGDDPLALYALSRTVIYGGEHHEAFDLLEQAARVAIRQNRAAELVAVINRDMDRDRQLDRSDRTVWRLSTHTQWLPIIRALAASDESLLSDDEDAHSDHD